MSYTPNVATAVSRSTVSVTSWLPVLGSYNYTTTVAASVTEDCLAGDPVAYPSGTADILITSPRGLTTTIPITVD